MHRPATVHTHVKSIFRKLHVRNKVGAAVWYVRHEHALDGTLGPIAERCPCSSSVFQFIDLLAPRQAPLEEGPFSGGHGQLPSSDDHHRSLSHPSGQLRKTSKIP